MKLLYLIVIVVNLAALLVQIQSSTTLGVNLFSGVFILLHSFTVTWLILELRKLYNK